MNEEIPYLSHELELFESAVNWKKYYSSFFIPYISGDVLEVGAGIGTTASYLINSKVKSYTCIEPDKKQSEEIRRRIENGILPKLCKVDNGILKDDIKDEFDTVIYIDVIEHINDDAKELVKAAKALKKGGYLCILVPANPLDYSPFDKEIGHYRRYSKQMLINIIPQILEIKYCKYFDLCGSISSKVNKYFLKQPYPKKKQIYFWDSYLIPISKIIDPLLGNHWGKSLLLIAKK